MVTPPEPKVIGERVSEPMLAVRTSSTAEAEPSNMPEADKVASFNPVTYDFEVDPNAVTSFVSTEELALPLFRYELRS
jgi:hypothetical protein